MWNHNSAYEEYDFKMGNSRRASAPSLFFSSTTSNVAAGSLLGLIFIVGIRAGFGEFGGSRAQPPAEEVLSQSSELVPCSGESCIGELAPGASRLLNRERWQHQPPPPSPAPPPDRNSAVRGPAGHEWVGGIPGFAELARGSERADSQSRQPQNASLLLIGVLSGSKNFDPRFWVRRAFWAQRPWLHGVGWRFVVGTKVPKGDNDRLSLHYEAAKYGDMELVRGSELPPMQVCSAPARRLGRSLGIPLQPHIYHAPPVHAPYIH